MFEEEMPESDSSDEDFVPAGQTSDVSEEESDNAEPEDQEVEVQSVTKKRKNVKSSKANRRKKKRADEEEAGDIEEEKIEEPVKEECPEEKKKKADALWADFLKDVPTVKKKPDTPQNTRDSVTQERPENSETNRGSDRLQPEVSSGSSKTSDNIDMSSKSEQEDKVVEVFEFAGEKVVVEKKVDPRKRPVVGGGIGARGGGAAAILSQLNKKNKLSTLEKSKLDWESFKDKEGINEQLSAHNRGKNGYLEKQDFLERADLRQFEIEKQMRAHTRSKRV